MRWLVLLVALAGCLERRVTTCGDGTLCPADRVCSPHGCVLEEQLVACVGLADGDPCSFSGVPDGRCVDGACESFGCGNGVTEEDQGERCDDGNTISGDGCRGDCRKLEMCGDLELDEGEDCDDGNDNAADACAACAFTTWTAEAILGRTQATMVELAHPNAVTLDAAGNVYVVDSDHHQILRIDGVTGVITTVAGSGVEGFSGDGGPASAATLYFPSAVAIDGLGNVYVADRGNSRVRKVEASTGVITTIAGTGAQAFGGDGGDARFAALDLPAGLAIDGLGDLYIADSRNNRIRRIDGVTGIITTIAGDGSTAVLSQPTQLLLDGTAALYVADTLNTRVRTIDLATGILTTVAGNGTFGDGGDLGLATAASLNRPSALALDDDGNLFIADTYSHRVRRVDVVTQIITTYAGTGTYGFSGDGGAVSAAALSYPAGLAFGGGVLYVADTFNDRIRAVTAGVITTFAGTGGAIAPADGGAGTSAPLDGAAGLAILQDGGLLVADDCRIRRLDVASGVVTTVVGRRDCGATGDGGPALDATLEDPSGLAADGAGGYYIADTANNRIRHVDAAGIITTVAGDGASGEGGDGGPATSAQLSHPEAVAVDAAGNLYVADTQNSKIRRVDAVTGTITTVAGDGSNAYGGDGAAATLAQLFWPHDLVIDAAGRVVVADQVNNRVRRLVVGGNIETIAGDGTCGSSGVCSPRGLSIDAAGDVYVTEAGAARVRRIDAVTSVISTVTGAGADLIDGDGGPAIAASVVGVNDVAVAADGTIYVSHDQRVRRVDAVTGVITTVLGAVDPIGMGPEPQARLANPIALVDAGAFTLVAGDASGALQAWRPAEAWLEVVAGRYGQDVATAALARYRDLAFGDLGGVAYDPAGTIYVSETETGTIHVIDVVDPDDATTWTIAPLTPSEPLREPTGLYLDVAAQILYVADAGDHAVRAIALPGGAVTTLAGRPGHLGFFGDDGLATDALLYEPTAITRCADGDFYLADTRNHRVRRITGGTITTVLGDGIPASSGQGSPARDFPVRSPRGLACDALGNLYVTSSTTVRQLAADDQGVVDGTGPVRSLLSRATFPGSVTSCLAGLVVVDDTHLHITDACTGMLIELERE